MNMPIEWSNEFPTEPGYYWFYGDPWFGSMGIDWKDDSKPKLEMYLVNFHRTGDGGMLGTTVGQIFYSRKFDRENRQSGWVGKFTKATLPEPPEDTT